MNVLYKTKTKAELRAESEKALKKFLKTGGDVQVIKAKKIPKSKMTTKSSRGFVAGTGGLSTGFPSKTFA
ncbi:hypothetical protein UFOVP240_145 [uncultured Caudovirales phage]|uniref:Peptidase A2 domain-containing protein n=1 Tax=uncultured Caudovirales phage TaxID=2100421 RepID=A0A6J7WTR9_9CAUD|nr:hypothetical protein UFOVP240_145 [uncultured Caudovirales phage]